MQRRAARGPFLIPPFRRRPLRSAQTRNLSGGPEAWRIPSPVCSRPAGRRVACGIAGRFRSFGGTGRGGPDRPGPHLLSATPPVESAPPSAAPRADGQPGKAPTARTQARLPAVPTVNRLQRRKALGGKIIRLAPCPASRNSSSQVRFCWRRHNCDIHERTSPLAWSWSTGQGTSKMCRWFKF